MTGTRLDKWLWAARFYKTRSLATDMIDKGRVLVNGQSAKPSREVRVTDRIDLVQAGVRRTVLVRGVSTVRGAAEEAQRLYDETSESVAARAAQATERRQGTEPALALAHGRPTKRDRRTLADWQRWSASAEPDER